MKKVVLALIAAVIIGFLLGSFVKIDFSKKRIEESVKRFYDLSLPGVTTEIASISSESGIYKILVKLTSPTGVSYREIFVTKDGKLLTEGVIFLEKSIEQIAKMKNFVDCLFDKKVRIYGVLNSTVTPEGAQATLLQLNLLGRYSPKLYFDCGGANLQACIKGGITQVPSVVINESRIEPGVKTVEWFSQQTGCKLE